MSPSGSSIIFQSTSPVWGTTCYFFFTDCFTIYFNPRPPCGGRRTDCAPRYPAQQISIHVPRVGDDISADVATAADADISIHVPRVGDDNAKAHINNKKRAISIHVPRVGDDKTSVTGFQGCSYFNPRPPCGGRPPEVEQPLSPEVISIHVPRVGDDGVAVKPRSIRGLFQSTSPVWGTTRRDTS